MDPHISVRYYRQNTLFQRWTYDTNRLLVDADSTGNVDIRMSTIGYVYTLGGTTVSWGSQLHKIAGLSTTEAEYVAITKANKDREVVFSFSWPEIVSRSRRTCCINQGVKTN